MLLDNEQFPMKVFFFLALFKTIPMCKVCCLKTSLPLLTVHFNANQACFHFSGRTPGFALRREANQKWSMFYQYFLPISYHTSLFWVNSMTNERKKNMQHMLFFIKNTCLQEIFLHNHWTKYFGLHNTCASYI